MSVPDYDKVVRYLSDIYFQKGYLRGATDHAIDYVTGGQPAVHDDSVIDEFYGEYQKGYVKGFNDYTDVLGEDKHK